MRFLDRTCISPAMTTGDVRCSTRTTSVNGEGEGFLFAVMVKAMTFVGGTAAICSVLVDRLPAGRQAYR